MKNFIILFIALVSYENAGAEFYRPSEVPNASYPDNHYIVYQGLVDLGSFHAIFSVNEPYEPDTKDEVQLYMFDARTKTATALLKVARVSSLYSIKLLGGQGSRWLIDIEGHIYSVDTDLATATSIHDFGYSWIGGSPGDFFTNIQGAYFLNDLYFIVLRDGYHDAESNLWIYEPKSMTIRQVDSANDFNLTVYSVHDDKSRSDQSVLLYGAVSQSQADTNNQTTSSRFLRFDPEKSLITVVGPPVQWNGENAAVTSKGLFFCGAMNADSRRYSLIRLSNSLTLDVVDNKNECTDVLAWRDQLAYFSGYYDEPSSLILSSGIVGNHRPVIQNILSSNPNVQGDRVCQANGKLFVNDNLGAGNAWVLDSDEIPKLLYKSDDLVIKQCLDDYLFIRNYKYSYVDGQYTDESRTFLHKLDSENLVEIKSRGSVERLSQLDGELYTTGDNAIWNLQLQSTTFMTPIIDTLLQ